MENAGELNVGILRWCSYKQFLGSWEDRETGERGAKNEGANFTWSLTEAQDLVRRGNSRLIV